MGRTRRRWVSQQLGSFHIISRTAGGDILFHDEEKEYFLKSMERFAAGFFVQVHAFCIMGNHFHILATGMELEAKKASPEELLHRYRRIYGKSADPPVGSCDSDGSINPDPDGGIERLRLRLGSISRFVQELKQSFSLWYNKRNDRKGYLWSDRFKGVIVEKGEAQLTCSTYMELNPVRAGLVQIPEDYRWSSLGLTVRNPKRAKQLLHPISPSKNVNYNTDLSWYREFVYRSGGIKNKGKHTLPKEVVDEVIACHGKLGIGEQFRYRVKNISEGVAIGTQSFISSFQETYNRKFIRPRSFLNGKMLYATRILK